jgi:hypothetical protein
MIHRSPLVKEEELFDAIEGLQAREDLVIR